MRPLEVSIATFHEKVAGAGECLTVAALTALFRDLAETFLYGGYIRIGDIRLYVTTVEFYFHADEDSTLTVRDPIVYHKGPDATYFEERMYINPHACGYDITFEDKALKYRAAALIREYAIYDEKRQQFLFLKRGSIFDDRVTVLDDHLRRCRVSLTAGKCNWEDEIDTGDINIEARKRIGINISEKDKRYGEYTDKWGLDINEYNARRWGFRRNTVPKLLAL